MIDYDIHATDGDIGHVEDFLVDDRSWAIRYLVVDTRNWWPGKHVLVSLEWVEAIDWHDATVRVSVSREAIRNAPEYDRSRPLHRQDEARLHDAVGRRGYRERGEAG